MDWIRTAVGVASLLFVAGITPETALAAVFYVAPEGADEASGTGQQPWRTIGHAVEQVGPGDLVVVAAGVYQESVAVAKQGTVERPIRIRGLAGAVLESPEPSASLSAFDVRPGAAHVQIEGFELRGGFAETVYLRPGSHHITLSALDIHDNRNAIWISGAHDVRVQDTVVHDNGRAAVRIFNGAAAVELIDVESRNNSDGLGCDGDADGFSADETVSNLYFERVVATGNSEDGLDLKADGVVLVQVVSRENTCVGLKLWAGGYVENTLVEGSKVGVTVVGSAGQSTVLRNVTLVRNATGLRVTGNDAHVVLRDSIVSGPAKAISYTASTLLEEDYNVLFRPEPGPLIERLSASGKRTFTPAEIRNGSWHAFSGQGLHTLVAEPFSADAAFVPGPESPAFDSGSASGSPPCDLDGVLRPAGAMPDRGAYERPIDVTRLQILAARGSVSRPGRDRLVLGARLIGDGLDLSVVERSGLTLTIRGDRTSVLRLVVPPDLIRVRGNAARVVVVEGRQGVRLLLQERAYGIRIDLLGRGLDLWDLSSGGLVVTAQTQGPPAAQRADVATSKRRRTSTRIATVN